MPEPDDASQPLMRASENDPDESQGLLHDTEADEGGLDRESQYIGRDDRTERPGLFVWALTATAALSGLLFGYE
jgi:hypothetical protein